MAHESFDPDISLLLDEFGAASEVMIGVIANYLNGSISAPEAESDIETIAEHLRTSARTWVADVIPRAYADGVTEALAVVEIGAVPEEDHNAMQGLAQRRLERRLLHAIDGLVVDALDRLDEALESNLAPLKTGTDGP